MSRLVFGNSLEVMAGMESESVDAIVTDPPYGLGFMGKDWDHGIPGVPFWEAARAVAKHGAHLLAFGGTRTFHRLTCAIEDAGWEIRDCLSWLYGSGFPKSHNGPWGGTALKPAHEPIILARKPLSAQDDLAILAPTTREALWLAVSSAKTDTHLSESVSACGFLSIVGSLSEALGALSENASRFTTATAFALITDLRILRSSLSKITHACTTGDLNATNGAASDVWLAASISRSVLAKCERLGSTTAGADAIEMLVEPEDGQEGAGLSPNWRPIILARKPLVGTVAANVEAHGTGALNVDACRIPGAAGSGVWGSSNAACQEGRTFNASPEGTDYRSRQHEAGRWPANVCLDADAAAMLDEQSGTLTSGANPTRRGTAKFRNAYNDFQGQEQCLPARGADTGGASRFFYCAKASRAEREEGLDGGPRGEKLWSSGTKNPGSFQSENTDRTGLNPHPTVKPVALMRWLCRLVTPAGGVVLDPFMGSGTTGIAAALEGLQFIGVELDPEYLAIAERRIGHASQQPSLWSAPREAR